MRREVRLAAATVGDVRVQLRRRQVGVPEHLLDRAEVGAAFEEVRGEGVAQQVRVDALGLEPGHGGEPAQDEERPRARERAAPRVEEELGPVALVEIRASVREVPAERVDGLASDRDDAFLRALAESPDEPVLEVDRGAVEPDRLAHAQARAVEELDERAVAQRPRRRAGRRVDQALRLARRQRPRQRASPASAGRVPPPDCRSGCPSNCSWR